MPVPAPAKKPLGVTATPFRGAVVPADGDAFAVDLYKATKASALSPASVRVAMAMAMVGAKGETKAALETALGNFTSLPTALRGWRGLNDVTLRFAQRLWVHEAYPLRTEYLDAVERDFDAKPDALDFTAPGSAERINAWIASATGGKIRGVVDAKLLAQSLPLMLGSATYFKGAWSQPFNHQPDRVFHAPSGDREVAFFGAWRSLKYGVSDDAHLVQVPFGSGGASMLFVVPKAIDGLDALEAALDHESFARYSASLEHSYIDFELPRFRVEADLSLGDALARLGAKVAFDRDHADFSGIDGTRDLYISSVIHKSFVEVDKNGAEAAAVTVVAMRMGSAAPQLPAVSVIGDRPFLFVLRDREGRVLFLGRVTEP